MARTKGHGNPKWTRDETILALDLYFQLQGNVPSSKSNEVRRLSELLRSLPYHAEAAKRPTFRNPDGVGFKLMNIRQVATGKGLGNVSKMDRQVWAEFGERPNELRQIATAIKSGIALLSTKQLSDINEEFSEGQLLTALRKKRKRVSRIRKHLLNERYAQGLRCDICDLSRPDLELSMQEAIFEVHHLIPLAETGERETKLSDMALLCACCHRLIHKAMTLKSDWIDIAEARTLFLQK